MPRLTKAERRKRSEQPTKNSKKPSKNYFDSIDDLNSAYLVFDCQESPEVNDSTTNATLSETGHASDSHASSQPEIMAAQTASTLKSRRSRHKASVTEPTTSTSTASSSNMSKSQLKKLAKLEEKKQKDARREALYESLQKNALNKDQMTLMKRSGTIGQRDTLKQRLHQAVQFSKMGIQKDEDRLVVERPRQTTTRNKKKADQSSKASNANKHSQDGKMNALQTNQKDYTNSSALSVANQQISVTMTDTTQTINSNMKLNQSKTENNISTDSTEKSLLNNEQSDTQTQDETQSDSDRQTQIVKPSDSDTQTRKENQSDSDTQTQSALTKLQALRQKNQRLAQDGKFAIDPTWINLEKARPQFQQTMETETSTSQQSNNFAVSLQLGATQRKTNKSTMKEQTKVEDTDQLGAHVNDCTQHKNGGTQTVLDAKQTNQLNDVESSKTSMTSSSQPQPHNKTSQLSETSMTSSSQPQPHNKTSQLPETSMTSSSQPHSHNKISLLSETSMYPKKQSSISSSSSRILVRRDHRIQENRMKLPVCQMEQEIMEMIHDNDVVILCGETGSGKTTQVPQFLYEAGYSSTNYPGLIGVTQPRRVAAVAMAQRVGTELGFPLDTKKGSVVGYQVRYDTNHSGSKTAIKFMTDGILMREIQTDLLLRKYSVIILDEAHERNINTDILIGLLSRAVPMRNEMARSKEEMSKSPKDRLYPLKLIIMSATLRVEDFTGNKKLFPIAPPVVHVRARQFPVTIHFSRRTELNNYLAEVERKVVKIHQKLPEGGILVFLTSQQEIEVLCAGLRNRFNRKKRRRERSNNHNDGLDHATIEDLSSSNARTITQQTSTNDASTSSMSVEDTNSTTTTTTTTTSMMYNDSSMMPSHSSLHNTPKRNDTVKGNQMGQKYDEKRQKIQDKQSTTRGSSMPRRVENVVAKNSQNGPQTPQNCPQESLNVQDNTNLNRNKQETEQTQPEDQEPTPVHVLPLYAMLPRAQQLKVFQTPPKNHRFIVVATNVAETSVTIPNIRYVVDSGRVKRRVYQSKSGISRYEVGWISQASANQRAGRAGRTQAGHCYRLYSSAVFSDQFNQFEPPEIESMPIESVVLQLKSIGVQHVIQFPFPSPPPISSLQNAIRSLTYLGALKPIFTSNNPTHSMTAAVLHHIHTNLENTNLSAAISSSDDVESATEHLAMVQYLTSNTIDQNDTEDIDLEESNMLEDTDVAKTNKVSFLPKAEYEILTPLGHAISRIPVTSHLAKFLLLTTENHIDTRNKVSESSLRLLDLAITIVASITVRNMFVTPQIPRRLKQQSNETSKQTTVGQDDDDKDEKDDIDANASEDDIDESTTANPTSKNDEETRMTNETELNEYQRQRELAKQAHAQLLDPTSDIFSLLRVIGSVMYSTGTSSSGSNGQTMKQYCQKTFLHYKSVKEALQLRQQLWRVIAHSLFDKEETWTGSSDTAELDDTTDIEQSNLSKNAETETEQTTKTKQSKLSNIAATETGSTSNTSTTTHTTGSLNQLNRTRFSQALDSTITPPTRQESNILLQYLTASSLGRIARRAPPNTMYSLLEQAGIRISPKSNGSSIPYIPSDPQFGPIVFVHPSSSVCTSKASDMPEWISFEEIITTSRPYAKFVTVIHPDWLVNASAGTNLCWFSPPLDIPAPCYNSTKDQVMAMFVPYFGPRSWRLTPIQQPFIPNHTKTYHQVAGIFGYALLSGLVVDGFEYLKQQYLIPPALLTRGGHQPCVVSLQTELEEAKIFSRKELIARWRNDSTFLYSAIRLWLPKSIRTKFDTIWHDQIVSKALEMNKNV